MLNKIITNVADFSYIYVDNMHHLLSSLTEGYKDLKQSGNVCSRGLLAFLIYVGVIFPLTGTSLFIIPEQWVKFAVVATTVPTVLIAKDFVGEDE